MGGTVMIRAREDVLTYDMGRLTSPPTAVRPRGLPAAGASEMTGAAAIAGG